MNVPGRVKRAAARRWTQGGAAALSERCRYSETMVPTGRDSSKTGKAPATAMLFDFLLALLGIGVLILGGELLVRGAVTLAASLGLSPLVIGLTVVAGGTSAPELVVSVMAAAKGNPGICAGNVVGSNIFNVLLILGVAAVVCPLRTTATFVRREIPIMVAVSILLFVLAINGELSRFEGAVLLVVFFAYNVLAIKLARRESAVIKPQVDQVTANRRDRSLPVSATLVVLGLAGLGGGSELFLRGSVAIAKSLHVSEEMIGLTLVAFGTSLPELVASAVAAMRKQPDICLGNVIGSNVFNVALILGVSGVVKPLPFSAELVHVHLPIMVGTSILIWPLVRSGLTLSRREGAILLMLFAAYLGWTIASRSSAGDGASVGVHQLSNIRFAAAT